MKIKQKPEDFVVEEVGGPEPSKEGPVGLYRLEKRNLATLEAVRLLARHKKLRPRDIAFFGMKDKYALTRQTVSVRGRPLGEVNLAKLRLVPLGRADRMLVPGAFEGNRFEITLRDLSADEADRVARRAERAAAQGLPNLFDAQRFHSVRPAEAGKSGARGRRSPRFIGWHVARGEWESALRIHLAEARPLDRAREKWRKKFLAKHWGEWDACLERLREEEDRAAVKHLAAYPEDFQGAFERLSRELALLYLSAYQSYLFNETLGALVRLACGGEGLFSVPYVAGRLVFFEELPERVRPRFAALRIPLVARDLAWSSEHPGEISLITRELLAAEGLTLGAFKLRAARHVYFPRAERAALVLPEELSCSEASGDELAPGRFKRTLSFCMPKGSYATLLVKFATRGMRGWASSRSAGRGRGGAPRGRGGAPRDRGGAHAGDGKKDNRPSGDRRGHRGRRKRDS